jgi:hypothetical protein
MAKKSRRARRAERQVAQPVRISRPSQTKSAPKRVDFAQEYHYVIEDLKRIGITAVALLILLVVAAALIG